MRKSFESVLSEEPKGRPLPGFAGSPPSAGADGGVPVVRPLRSVIPTEEVSPQVRVGRALMALRKGRRSERVAAAREIGDLAISQSLALPEAVVPLSVSLVSDGDPGVRQEAAWSLWKLGDERAHRPLMKALVDDPSSRVREKAARALGLLGAGEALPLMLDLITLERHIPARLRAGIACALGYFASGEVLKHLVSAARDAEPYVRYEAVRSLGRFLVGFSQATAAHVFRILKKYLRPRSEPCGLIRQAAIKALRFSNSPEANAVVARALTSDPDPTVREVAAEAMLLWNSPESEAALVDALADDFWPVRKVAARSLARFIMRHGVHDSARISESLRRMERMLPSHSYEWRLAADAFASL